MLESNLNQETSGLDTSWCINVLYIKLFLCVDHLNITEMSLKRSVKLKFKFNLIMCYED